MNKTDDKQDEDECLRQSHVLLGDSQETETLSWLETAADTEGWVNEDKSRLAMLLEYLRLPFFN